MHRPSHCSSIFVDPSASPPFYQSPSSRIASPLDVDMYTDVGISMCGGSRLTTYHIDVSGSLVSVMRCRDRRVICYIDVYMCHVRCVKRVKACLEETGGEESVAHVVEMVSRGGLKERLYCRDEGFVDRFMQHARRYCIKSRFNSEYRCVKVIGKGNFAKVYQVERRSDGRQFAAKVFDKREVSRDDNDRRSLLYEVGMMREMNHPHCMRLEELFEGDNFVYCVCELYTGGSMLDRVMKVKKIDVRRALVYTRQLLMVASYFEKKSIIHRDMKPENILMKDGSEDSDIVVVDFGFATYEEDFDKLFVRCGTPGYVAPEILADEKYGVKVDVFSIGVILYIMLTGNVPFDNKSYDRLVEENARCEIDFKVLHKTTGVNEQGRGV